jgi:hypothetical protein
MQHVASCNTKVVSTEMWAHAQVCDCIICTNADQCKRTTKSATSCADSCIVCNKGKVWDSADRKQGKTQSPT